MLKEAERPLEERVVDFLSKHSEQAFTLWEIYSALEGYDKQTASLGFFLMSEQQRQKALEPYVAVLDALLRQRRITAARYQSTQYFAIVR